MRKLRNDEEYEPEMPPVTAEHVLHYFFDIGPVLQGEEGPMPLTHVELAAWQSNTGIDLASWEATFLHRLSREYLAQMRKSEKADCLAPWHPEGLEARLAASDSLKDTIRGLMRL